MHLLFFLVELWFMWRIYLCVGIALGSAQFLEHCFFNGAMHTYGWLTCGILGAAVGIWWQIKVWNKNDLK